MSGHSSEARTLKEKANPSLTDPSVLHNALPRRTQRMGFDSSTHSYYVNTQNGCSEVGATIKVTRTSCNYGGTRPWFLCPRGGCGRRVAILYGGSDFGCRTCRRLTYPTQRIPPTSRSLDRAQRLRVRLGGSVDMTQPFPGEAKRDAPTDLHEVRDARLACRGAGQCRDAGVGGFSEAAAVLTVQERVFLHRHGERRQRMLKS